MAAFSPVAVEGLVLLACVEWWKTAHTVVIRVDQAHLKHESRSRSRNSQLDPQGTPTALYKKSEIVRDGRWRSWFLDAR